MTDFANLVLGVDATSVNAGADALDRLTASGSRATGVSNRFANSTRATGVAAAQMATQAQSMSVASVAAASGLARTGLSANNARIAMLDMTHVGINMTQMLASGVDPMRALVLESGRIATAFQYGAGGMGALIKSGAEWIGILKVTRDAELAEIASNAAMAAQAVQGSVQRAAAAIAAADTEVALAEAALRVAGTSEAEAAAQAQLAAAHQKVAGAAIQAEIAENALAKAQGRAAEASAISAARTVTSIGGMGVALAGLAVVAGVAFAGIHSFQKEVEKSGVLDKYAEGLRLTDAQIKKAGGSVKYLADGTREITGLTVSFGNIAQATFQILAERAGLSAISISDAFGKAFSWLGNFGKFTIALLVAGFSGLIELVISVGQNLGRLATGNYEALTNPLQDVKKHFKDTFNEVESGFDAIGKRAIELQKQDYKALSDANKPKKPPNDKKASDHGLADALAELDAQIRGQEALAAAYQVSDAAALKAEAMQKAEEQAIRHKGEIALFYEKELALAVATRVAEGEKAAADLRFQAASQKEVNDAVAEGSLTLAKANQQLQLEAGLRPLKAAYEAAIPRQKQAAANAIRDYTQAQKEANDESNRAQVLAATSAGNDQLDRIKLETSLIGKTNIERAKAIALLEAQQFLEAHPSASADTSPEGVVKAMAHAREYIKTQVGLAEGAVKLNDAQTLYNNSLTYTADLLQLMDERAQTLASTLSSAFGSVGSGLGEAITALTGYAAQQAKLDADHQAAVNAGLSDEHELSKFREASTNNQLAGISRVVGGLKSMFKEHSAGYKVMDAAEKALAVVQAVNAAKSLVNAAKSVIAGGAKMFEQLGVWAFPAVAAMVAVMAGLGFAGAGANGTQKPPDIPTAGTGTVLGSPDAQSQSIANSLELMSKNSTKGLDQGAAMVSSLRSIQDDIGKLAGALARSLNLPGGFFDTTGKVGTSSHGIQGLFGSTTTKSLYDQGLTINSASLQQILDNGITGSTYQVIEKIKKSSGFLGLGGGTKTSYSTSTGALDADVSKQFQLVISDISKSIVEAGKLLGFDVEAALKTFQVQIGQISFKDMNADEIQKTLEAVFSKVADQMAGFAIAGLAQFQQAGEGLYETLMRVAKDFFTVGTALKSIGLVAPASIAAREALVKLAGGLDAFVSQANFYYENFLTPKEQTAFLQDQVNAAFAGLGLAVPSSIDAFKKLVSAQDLTTEAGQAMYTQLMAVAPAFYNLKTATEQAAAAAKQAADALAKQKTQLQIDLLNAQGKSVEALAKKRQMELAAMDASLRGLQEQVWAAQDLAKAKDNLLTAYKRESQELQTTIDKFKGFSTDLRAFRDGLTGAGSGADSYQATLVKLMQQSGLANNGDEGALGGGLTTAAQNFLDTATAQAGSLQDVARARALVMRSLDSAIGASDAKASVAQQQLDQMKTQVSALVDINESVQTVAQAIEELRKLLAPPPQVVTGGGTVGGTLGGAANTPREHRQRQERHQVAVVATLESIQAAVEQGTVSQNRIARVFRNADRGGAIAVATDADSPLATSGVELA